MFCQKKENVKQKKAAGKKAFWGTEVLKVLAVNSSSGLEVDDAIK